MTATLPCPPVAASSPGTVQPTSASKLTADSVPEVFRSLPGGSLFTVTANRSSTAMDANDVDEPPKQQPLASTAVNAVNSLSETKPSSLRISSDVNDNDFVLATTTTSSSSSSSPIHLSVPSFTAVEHPASSLFQETRSADPKLEKLETKNEFVDLEVLMARMTKLKRIVDGKQTKTACSTRHAAGSSGAMSLSAHAESTITAAAAAAAAAVATSSTSSKSTTTAKSSRWGSDRKERDESWQKYLKRSAVFTSVIYLNERLMQVR